MYEISSGAVKKSLKILLYGTEGIGKSTFAAQMPDPLFIDTEGSTTHMDVRRLPAPTSFAMLLDEIDYVKKNPNLCKTLVVDTVDWAERICRDDVLAKYDKSGVEDFGYGKGYTYIVEEFGKMLNKLNEVVERGVNVFTTAHARISKFEQPDEMGAYDRWGLKLIDTPKCSNAAIMKEWADIVLFANYETYVVMEAGKEKAKKGKAQGGRRVMYTTHHPCWDAKNRFGLADKLPFDFGEIAHLFEDAGSGGAPSVSFADSSLQEGASGAPKTQPPAQMDPCAQQAGGASPAPTKMDPGAGQATETGAADGAELIPVELKQLMDAAGIAAWEVEDAVAKKGYYPAGMHISEYDPGFVHGCLIGAWDSVRRMVEDNRI